MSQYNINSKVGESEKKLSYSDSFKSFKILKVLRGEPELDKGAIKEL